ncbi:hypothetical protein [Lacimonas salitolerans]|uniref:Regulatory helix-turn-helix protein, lysR family n=1 Tax=Lacimonas salitolerans TaxID=1323750 RepID=A0ABW4EHM5_9RHOB
MQHRKQIADLEKIVGSLIVMRDRNRLYLTPVGLRLTKLALMVLAQIERAALDIGGLAAGILRNRSCNTLCYSMANFNIISRDACDPPGDRNTKPRMTNCSTSSARSLPR